MFQNYKWKKRLLISYFHDDESQSFMKEEINRFFINNNQAIEERRLKHIAITRDDFDINQIPLINKDTFGLVGLDGTLKRPKDLKLLESLFDVMLYNEKNGYGKKCQCSKKTNFISDNHIYAPIVTNHLIDISNKQFRYTIIIAITLIDLCTFMFLSTYYYSFEAYYN